MQQTWVRSLGWEDPLEEGMATHSSILAWRIPMDSRASQARVQGVTKSRTRLSDFTSLPITWRAGEKADDCVLLFDILIQ